MESGGSAHPTTTSILSIPPKRDKVAREFTHLDPFPWTKTNDNALIRIGSVNRDMVVSVSIDIIRRPWLNSKIPAQFAGQYGYLYDVHLNSLRQRTFYYANFLKNTKHMHNLCCHIFLFASGGTIRITIPSIVRAPAIVDALRRFIDMATKALRPAPAYSEEARISALAQESPEYILGPDHPLAFLAPDMPCSMFGITADS